MSWKAAGARSEIIISRDLSNLAEKKMIENCWIEGVSKSKKISMHVEIISYIYRINN